MDSNRIYYECKNAEKREKTKQRRELMILIMNELLNEGFYDAVQCIKDHASWNVEELKICDNIDLSLIFAEYLAYYQSRFGKKPQICKKVEKPPLTPLPKVRKTRPQKSSSDEIADSLEVVMPNIPNIPKHLSKTEESRDLAEMLCLNIADGTPTEDWKDVSGHEGVKETLQEAVILPIFYPDAFSSLCASSNVLLYGPPGTGKTQLVRILASKLKDRATFFALSASSLTSKWRGESEKLVKILFEIARHNSPSIVFIDEVDALLGDRGNSGEHEASRRTKAEFLIQVDGFQSMMNRDVRIIASTNLPWTLDTATLRRFSDKCYVGLPGPTERGRLITNLVPNLDQNVLQDLINASDRISGSDLKSVLTSTKRKVIAHKLLKSKDFNFGVEACVKLRSLQKMSKAYLLRFENWQNRENC